LLDDLKKRQKILDQREQEKHEKEIEQTQAQIDLIKEQIKHVGEGIGGVGNPAGKKIGSGKGYSRREQHEHEKTRGTAARREGLQKAEAKKL
jgi:hypothetical protein